MVETGIIGITPSPSIGSITPFTADNQIDRGGLVIVELHQILVITQDNDIGVVEALDAAGVGKCLIIDRVTIKIDGVAIDVHLKRGLIITTTAVILVFITLNAVITLSCHLILLGNVAIDRSRLGWGLGLDCLDCLSVLGLGGIVINVIIVLGLNQAGS